MLNKISIGRRAEYKAPNHNIRKKCITMCAVINFPTY